MEIKAAAGEVGKGGGREGGRREGGRDERREGERREAGRAEGESGGEWLQGREGRRAMGG